MIEGFWLGTGFGVALAALLCVAGRLLLLALQRIRNRGA